MALIALAADKGSPGVTTTAITLAAVWPRRALLAELDPSGGDVALRLRGPRGAPLSPEVGLISLAVGVRRGMRPKQIFEHVQRLDGGLEVVVGLSAGEQGSGLSGLWGPVGELLDMVPGVDVIADCGRLYPGSPAADVLAHARPWCWSPGPTIDAVAHLRARAARGAARARPRPGRPPQARGRGGDQPAGRHLAEADRAGAAPGRAAGPGARPDRARPEGRRPARRRVDRPAGPVAAGALGPGDRRPAAPAGSGLRWRGNGHGPRAGAPAAHRGRRADRRPAPRRRGARAGR